MIFDRFSQPARRTIVAAQDAALDLGHDHIGTEHLLLGLLGVPGTGAYDVLAERGVTPDRARSETVRRMSEAGYPANAAGAAVDTLAAMGIDIEELRRRADNAFGAGKFVYPRPGFTARAKHVLEATLREALALDHVQIVPEHLLLGLLAEGEGLALAALVNLEVDPADLRTATLARLT